MRDAPPPEGMEYAPADFWIEDSVTRAMRAAKPKGMRPLTDAEAHGYIDRLLADHKRQREAREAAKAAR